MTTTIVPSLGNAPLMTQAGTGASPGYQAIDVRRMASDFELGEGVSTYNSFLVQQRGAGANMSVDISMDDLAYIRGDAVTLQGLYPCPPHSATINETISTADPTNPRCDRVILELKDNTHDASGSNLVQTRVVAGTPSGGATLDNLTGAAAVPASAMLLADVLVGAAVSSITNANIRDRRPFIAGVPPVLADRDEVSFLPALGALATGILQPASANAQEAAPMILPRRIVGATRIRWKYTQAAGTPNSSNYVIGIYDASGRKIIDTGAVAFTGTAASPQQRAETISATTFEPGLYYVLMGVVDGTNRVSFTGVSRASACVPNGYAISASGAATAPTTILGFSDGSGNGDGTAGGVPRLVLSVG